MASIDEHEPPSPPGEAAAGDDLPAVGSAADSLREVAEVLRTIDAQETAPTAAAFPDLTSTLSRIESASAAAAAAAAPPTITTDTLLGAPAPASATSSATSTASALPVGLLAEELPPTPSSPASRARAALRDLDRQASATSSTSSAGSGPPSSMASTPLITAPTPQSPSRSLPAARSGWGDAPKHHRTSSYPAYSATGADGTSDDGMSIGRKDEGGICQTHISSHSSFPPGELREVLLGVMRGKESAEEENRRLQDELREAQTAMTKLRDEHEAMGRAHALAKDKFAVGQNTHTHKTCDGWKNGK